MLYALSDCCDSKMEHSFGFKDLLCVNCSLSVTQSLLKSGHIVSDHMSSSLIWLARFSDEVNEQTSSVIEVIVPEQGHVPSEPSLA